MEWSLPTTAERIHADQQDRARIAASRECIDDSRLLIVEVDRRLRHYKANVRPLAFAASFGKPRSVQG